MANRVENIKPYGNEGTKAEQVERMFDSIAPAYDFMNRAMTLGIDKWWRRVAIKRVARHVPTQSRLLDIATGTGDFALQLVKQVHPLHVTGIDLSNGMLAVAQKKAAARTWATGHISFQQGDCLHLSMNDNTFHAVTVAFGVRNFEQLDKGYCEMLRVLQPGGMVCVLELSTPRNRVIRWFYDLYTLHIIPWAGSLRSGDHDAYRYLPQSIAAVPQGDDMLGIMRRAGFAQCAARRLTLGICTIYTGIKPA